MALVLAGMQMWLGAACTARDPGSGHEQGQHDRGEGCLPPGRPRVGLGRTDLDLVYVRSRYGEDAAQIIVLARCIGAP